MATSDVIPVVDLRLLSHSEISALAAAAASSASSSSLADLDAAAPKIDRSVFNESAGSRKQTFFRLRLAPRSNTTNPSLPSSHSDVVPRRRGRPRSTPAPLPPLPPQQQHPNEDPDSNKSQLIASLLRSLFVSSETLIVPNENSKSLLLPEGHTNLTSPITVPVVEGSITNPTLQESDEKKVVLAVAVVDERDKEILNAKNVALNLVELGQLLDPYADELRRRTASLSTAEQLVGYLSGIGGQWGSSRRRKKIVDAAGFGDHLPKGWKLLLRIRRKKDLAWLDVGKYISPSGKKFASCKEVSAYILSLVGSQEVMQPRTAQITGNIATVASLNPLIQNAGPNNQNGFLENNPNILPMAPLVASPAVDTSREESKFLNQANVAQVDIQYPQTSLGDKAAQAQHALISQQRSRKRRKLVKTITDGVIVNKEGMFECQFCHKAFTVISSYYGHVGTHVKHERPSVVTPTQATARQSTGAIADTVPSVLTAGGTSKTAANNGTHTLLAVPVSAGTAAEATALKSIDTSVAILPCISSAELPAKDIVENSFESSAAVLCTPTEVTLRNKTESSLNSLPAISSAETTVEFTARKSSGTSIVPCVPVGVGQMHDFNGKCEDPSSAIGVTETVKSVSRLAVNFHSVEEMENRDLNKKPNFNVPETAQMMLSRCAGYNTDGSDRFAVNHSNDSEPGLAYEAKEFVEPSNINNSVLDKREAVSKLVHSGPYGYSEAVSTSKSIDGQKGPPQMSDYRREEALVINGLCFKNKTPISMDKIDLSESEHRSPLMTFSQNNSRHVCGIANKSDQPARATDEFSIKPVECTDTLQLSCPDVNSVTPGMLSKMELSSSNLVCDEKSGRDKKQGFEHSITFGNGSNCDIRNYVQNPCCTMGEGSFAQRDISVNGDQQKLDLQRCVLTLFDDRNAQSVELNSDCSFQKSLLEETNQPPTELELFDIRTHGYYDDVVSDAVQNAISGGPLPVNVTDTWVQPSPGPAFFDMIPDQCESVQNFIGHQTNLDLFGGHGMSSVSEPQLGLGYGSQVESNYPSARQLGWGISLAAAGSGCGVSSVCVWCGRQFNHEGGNVGPHPDSLGFMCPTCKSRIE